MTEKRKVGKRESDGNKNNVKVLPSVHSTSSKRCSLFVVLFANTFVG